MSRYPVCKAVCTASAVTSGGVWNTPNPKAGISTPLFRVRFIIWFSCRAVCSAVDHPLHGLGIPVAEHGDRIGRGADCGQVTGGQLDARGAEVLLEALQPAGAGDGDDPGLLREQPGQRD